jgi:hypothetical protein
VVALEEGIAEGKDDTWSKPDLIAALEGWAAAGKHDSPKRECGRRMKKYIFNAYVLKML